jgi:hypothetical protein
MDFITLKVRPLGQPEKEENYSKLSFRFELLMGFNHSSKIAAFEGMGEYVIHDDSIEYFIKRYKIGTPDWAMPGRK